MTRPTEINVAVFLSTIQDTLDSLRTVDTTDFTALLVGAEIIREAAGHLVVAAEEHKRAIIAEMAEATPAVEAVFEAKPEDCEHLADRQRTYHDPVERLMVTTCLRCGKTLEIGEPSADALVNLMRQGVIKSIRPTGTAHGMTEAEAAEETDEPG